MTRQQFQAAVKPITERVQARLQGFGYSPTEDQMTSFRMTTLPFIALVLMFGIMKAWIGAERQHPVGILIFLLVAHSGRRPPARKSSDADAGWQRRFAELSELPCTRIARPARSRASSRRGNIRHRYPVRDLPRIGLCGLADDERRRRRRQCAEVGAEADAVGAAHDPRFYFQAVEI